MTLPGGGVLAIKLGAGVSAANLRVVLTWAYSGRLDVRHLPTDDTPAAGGELPIARLFSRPVNNQSSPCSGLQLALELVGSRNV